jgi:hypothetical protein
MARKGELRELGGVLRTVAIAAFAATLGCSGGGLQPRDDAAGAGGMGAAGGAGGGTGGAAGGAGGTDAGADGPDENGCCPPDPVMSGCTHLGGYSANGRCDAACDFFCSTNWRIENDAHGCPEWRYDLRQPMPGETPYCFPLPDGGGSDRPDATPDAPQGE